MLQQGAADAVHDALRFPRGAAGEHDVERRVERLAREGDVGGLEGRHKLVEAHGLGDGGDVRRSEEHTSELQSLMRISYAVFCLKKKNKYQRSHQTDQYEITRVDN